MQNGLKIVLAALAAALAAGGLVLFLTQPKGPAPVADRAALEKLENDNRTLSARTEALAQEAQQLRAQLAAQGIAVQPPSAAQAKPVREENNGDTARQLAAMQQKLQAANASLGELQNKIGDLESSLARVTEENKKLVAGEAEFKENLASTNRLVQTMESELKVKTERIVQLEAAAKKLREDQSAAAARTGQITGVLREIEDINRRRETTLTSLQRRYRDLTDQFRALALRLDTQRDNPTPITADVGRIQTVVQSAEEDLRVLVSLNTQAQRAGQKLGAR